METTSEEFYKDFIKFIKEHRGQEANAVLMKELGKILVKQREDFIYVLKYSGIIVPDNATDIDLVNLFIDNIHKNKSFLLGVAFLIAHHNKMVGFDGEEYTSNICADAIYKHMKNHFDGGANADLSFSRPRTGNYVDLFSNAGGGGILDAAGGIADKIASIKQQKLENSPQSLLAKKAAAKNALIQSVVDQRKTQADADAKKQESKSKLTKIIVISTVSLVALGLIIGLIVYIKKMKKK